jgi:hypothetical protein
MSDSLTYIKGKQHMSEKATRLKKKSGQRKVKYRIGCSNKTRFKSLEHAKKAKERIRYISIMESSDGKQSDYLPIRAFFCSNCAGFHLTSRPDRDDITISLAG